MNLLEALKQIAEHTDDKQAYMPRERNFPPGLLNEMYRQTANAQKGIGNHGRDIRLNPDAVARFMAEQPVSANIDDRRGEIQPMNEFHAGQEIDRGDGPKPYSVDLPEALQLDPNDPLAQLLGINSIGPRAMTVPENVPLPRARPRR